VTNDVSFAIGVTLDVSYRLEQRPLTCNEHQASKTCACAERTGRQIREDGRVSRHIDLSIETMLSIYIVLIT